MPNGWSAVQESLAKLELGAQVLDCLVTVRVCQAVTRRAAHLSAAGKLV